MKRYLYVLEEIKRKEGSVWKTKNNKGDVLYGGKHEGEIKYFTSKEKAQNFAKNGGLAKRTKAKVKDKIQKAKDYGKESDAYKKGQEHRDHLNKKLAAFRKKASGIFTSKKAVTKDE